MENQLPALLRLAVWCIDLLGRGLQRFLANFSPFWRQGKSISEPKRILILHCMHLGDTIAATPALRALRQRFPNAYIVFFAQQSGAQILQGNPDVNEVICFSPPWYVRDDLMPHNEPNRIKRWSGLIACYYRCFKTLWRVSKQLRNQKFDCGIDLAFPFWHAFLMVLARIPIRVGPKDIGSWLLTHPVYLSDLRTLHEIERCLNIVKVLGVETKDHKPFVAILPEAEQRLTLKLSQYRVAPDDLLVVIHPGCRSAPASRWRPERWAQVANTLIREYGAKVVLNGVESERPEIEAIKAHMKEKAIDFCGQLTIPELVALIKRCNLLLTVNSGPMHIASALGTPMVVVQGAWNLARWRPYGDNHILVVKDVPCANCGFRICPKPVSCMDMITPEEVIDAAVRKLQEIGAIKR